MGKDWQLLGEVPDSDDDDGLDSQESLPDLPVQQDLYGDLSEDEDTILADAPAVEAAVEHSVMSVVLSPRKSTDIDIPAEVPSSPPRQKTPQPISQESSALSSLPGFDDDDEIDLVDDGLPVEDEKHNSQPRSQALVENYDISNDTTKQEGGPEGQEDEQNGRLIRSQETPKPRPQSQQLSQASHTSYTPPQRPRTPQQSQPRHISQQDADAPQPAPQTADPFSWSPTSSLSSLSRSPSPMLPELAPQPAPASTHPSSGHRASSPPFEFPVIPDSPRAFRLGFVRSLRPRKPIQQHPYLLENAKYTHAMKRHGMKPVRTGYNPSTQRQPANTEEDSQEQYEQPSEHDTQLPDVLSDPAFINDDLYDFPSSPPAREKDRDRPDVPSLFPSTSTPANRLLFLASSQGRADDGTDDTSMAEEDDFPNPATYFQERRKRQLESLKAAKSSKSKRHGTPPTSSAAKRARLLDAALQPGAQTSTTPPRAKWIPVPFSSSPEPLPRPSGRMRVIRSSSPPIPSPPPQPYTIPDLSEPESAEDLEEAEEEDAGENEADAVRHNVRRIKGVLPASWLRLDKQKARPSNDRPPPTQRRPGPVDNAPRRGVALPRQGTGSAPFLASIFDDSDDNDSTPTPIPTTLSTTNDNDNDNNNTYTRSRPKIAAADLWSEMDDDDGLPVYQVIDDEDIGSVMESDVIDRMESGPGRSRPTGNKKNTKTRQPKIDRMFDRAAASSIAHKTKSKSTGLSRTISKSSTSKSATSKPRSAPRASGSGSGTAKPTRRAPKTPPMLSILDFVESSPRIRQPDFIRVAARAARKSHTLGKASPSRKVINLGSRSDNVDALSVLQDWRASKIQPRIPNPARLKPRKPQSRTPSGAGSGSGSRSNSGRPQHPALHEISANLPIPRQPSSLKALTQPAKRPAKKQYVNSISQPRLAAPRQLASTAPTANSMRPAQLETAVRRSRDTAAGFVAKKRALDEMYRQRRKEAAVRPNVHLEQFLDNQSNYGSVDMDAMDAMEIDDFAAEQTVEQPPAPAPAPASAKKTKTPRKQVERSRFRKQYVPQAVDTSAPRFVHALDPLLVNTALVGVDITADTAGAAAVDVGSDKLRGLGPYGSQYSQHFDIFPLDSGVFFHKSTILGSGRLAAALGSFLAADMQASTPVLSFQLDERTLCWTAWNDVSSSEFGILMDWLADSLFSASQPAPLTTTTLFGPKVHTLFNFILDFVQSTISVANVEARKAFVLRTMEVVGNFVKRFESASILQPEVSETSFNMVNNSHLASLTGTITIMSWLLRICRDTPECKMYAFQAEDMLCKVAKVCARTLLKHGLDSVRASYNDLHRPSLRERGIRRDLQALCSWVVLVKALEHARVPRSGFWDVTYWAMYGNTKDKNALKVHTTTDAGRLEQLWEDMFTLLPLTEFDSAGAVQAGIRQSMPVDGWELPKKVLERVFQVYKANPHQSPSFNAYCRALVGRCHYLVQEWGWRSCKAVIGTIFDFYGSQDFAHLRNEEVYNSPRFLEELASSPSLKIESEDKCFHIFLKMLGVVILELKRLGLTKEMANLVARILPNHDRQYSKEADVHQRDLAALRNHHDLLCTLYWAVSPEVRPPLHQIEKLVAPAHSHKEACLINIRAWNQLARFVVVGNEGYGVYRGFVAWMRNIFNSMLEQYQSAESDMHRQFENLSKSMMQGIGPEMVKAMTAANQAAALDVLQACAAASFDVMQRAPTLGVATYCLSTDQLEGIFVKLDLSSSKCTNWTIFQTALDVLEHYMDRIDAVMDAQYASLNSNTEDGISAAVDPAEADEAVMLLDHSVARGLFRLINTITHMSWDDLPRSVAAVRVQCTEKSLALAARLAGRFVHAGMYNLGKFFGSTNTNDYSLFEKLPHAPGLVQRRYLPLFVCGLVGSNVFDLKDLGGTNMLEQWLLAVVKPARFLGYENRLARVLQQHNLPYLYRANISDGQPSYDANRAYFACAMASMRQQLREEDSLTQPSRKHLRADFARALRLVMNQIKEDLRFLSRSAATAAAAGHGAYVIFVREIVALIRSHGGDICTLDDFYLKQSIEYAPSPEDPQLRAASIVTYGLRLTEGEATAAPQLFYYLHNSFNIALANGELAAECRLLERSMAANGGILKFVLERMLPAILRVCISTNHKVATACWPLLDVYCSAVEQFLTESVVPQGLDDEVMAGGIASLFGDIVQLLVYAFGGFDTEADEETETETATLKVRIRTMAQLAALANVLRPLIMASVCLPACTDETRLQIQASIASLYELVTVYGDASTSAGELLSAITRGSFATASLQRPAPQVAQFAASITKHVADNWTVEADGSINVKRSSTTATSTATFSWSMDELVDELRRQLGLWTLVPVHMRFSSNGRRRPYEGRVRAVQR